MVSLPHARGAPNKIIMDQKTLQELQTLLQAEHDKLTAELRAIATPDPKVAGHWDTKFPQFEIGENASHAALDEEADEVEEYEVRLASEDGLETRLLTVNKALVRIKQGTYGMCAKCKKPIPPERLRANPAAEYDIEHTP